MRQIERIAKELNSILKFHNSNQFLSYIIIDNFYICVLLIALFFPFLALFGSKDPFYRIILIFIYCLEMSLANYPIVWANTLVSEKVFIIFLI